MRLGREVLAVDESYELVQKWSHRITHIVQADTTDDEALAQLGVSQVDVAVVAIGSDIEASVLTVLALKKAGVREIWAKAITAKHGEILERIGAKHVIFPDQVMGERVAHLMSGTMSDYLQFDDGFAIARAPSPNFLWDKALRDAGTRTQFHITIIGIKRVGEDFLYAVPETVVRRGDELILCGPTVDVEAFCAKGARR